MKANFATFANALCHLNATPLSVAVLAPCAWGKNLACGGTWQSVAKWAVFAGEVGKVKMGQCLGGGLLSLSLSLSLSRCLRFWHTKIFKRFVYALLRPFCHFEPLQKGEKSTHLPFLDTSLTLKMTRVCRHREQKKR